MGGSEVVVETAWPTRAWIVQEFLLNEEAPIMLRGRHNLPSMGLCHTAALLITCQLPNLAWPNDGEGSRCLTDLGYLPTSAWSGGRLALSLLQLLAVCRHRES